VKDVTTQDVEVPKRKRRGKMERESGRVALQGHVKVQAEKGL
jgi:hypothetical protein